MTINVNGYYITKHPATALPAEAAKAFPSGYFYALALDEDVVTIFPTLEAATAHAENLL